MGLDRYCAGARYPISDTIGRSYTDTDIVTALYNFFVLKMQFCVGYKCVQVIRMRGICMKILHRLETIGVCCNSVDC